MIGEKEIGALISQVKKIAEAIENKNTTAEDWIDKAGTWSAIDAKNISISSDLSSELQKGDKLKLTNNSSTKYYTITTNPTFSSPNTTFEVTGEIDLVTGGITNQKISRLKSPLGMQDWTEKFKFRGYRTVATGTLTAGFNKVAITSESYDTSNNFDNATNYRFTAPVAGVYRTNGRFFINDTTTRRVIAVIYKNGTEALRGTDIYTGQYQGCTVSGEIYLTKGDYIEFWSYGSVNYAIHGEAGGSNTWFDVHFVSI